MKIEERALDKIRPYPQSARKITQQPIVIDKKGVIIAGHTRHAAAKQLGWKTAPVHIATNLSPSQVRQYRLMDNRSHEYAAWDMDVLKLEFGELKGLDLDLSLTGFSSREIDGLTRRCDQSGSRDAPDGWRIIKHLQRGEIAYEPFAGTGPQFIAAELTERRCFGLELEPAYCDVIVTRWQNLTGKLATLDGSHGVTFDQVKLGRRMGERDAIVEEAFT